MHTIQIKWQRSSIGQIFEEIAERYSLEHKYEEKSNGIKIMTIMHRHSKWRKLIPMHKMCREKMLTVAIAILEKINMMRLNCIIKIGSVSRTIIF